MANGRSEHDRALDDLRSGFDRDDDDLVRDALDRLTRRRDAGEQSDIAPPRPREEGEVVCRSCRLVVRRHDLRDVALLVCDDCYQA